MAKLNDAEITEICGGLRQSAAQLRNLHKYGFVNAKIVAGEILLDRSHYEAVCKGISNDEPELNLELSTVNNIPRSERSKKYWEEWRKANKNRPRMKKLRKREVVNYHANKRRADKLIRTPSWADLDEIRTIYAKCERMRQETGFDYVVDHVIPLRGKSVSGLHIHTNLQIITSNENSRKKNKFEQ